MGKKLRVCVLFGGQSGEHEVSLASAQSVITALEAGGKYDVVPIGVRPTGQWIAGPQALQVLAAEAKFLLPESDLPSPGTRRANDSDGTAVLLADEHGAALVQVDDPKAMRQRVDVVFPVLHGPHGEDGTVQGLLELAGVPYVGCGVAASAVGMDKDLMKTLFKAAGLPVADWVALRKQAWIADPDATIARALGIGPPCFVKPANMGSSVGISRASDEGELRAGLDEAFRFDTKAIVERAIEAREIECSVLGNDEPRASVPGEIVPSGEFYDYHAKYLAEQPSKLIIPAGLDEDKTREVQELAIRAFRAIDGAGMARADFLLEKGSDRLFLNELNSIPGFTRISMYTKLWEATGLDYPALLDELVRLAIARHEERAKLETSYTPPSES